jgi:tetratricopeptide (TPR) repeat protein
MTSSGPDGWLDRVLQGLREAETGAADPPRIDRYEIRGEIGKGSSAAVYRAWDTRLRRPVALKLLRENPSSLAVERFRREAQTMAGLRHPNLIQVHDTGEMDGRPFLILELVEGVGFGETMRQAAKNLPRLAGILEQAARGVQEAHRHGVVHRDLKPGNILVDASGAPRVGDFGLAHLQHSDEALTRTGTTLGTPLYMSPEQVRGDAKRVSPRTDVYALGVILYEILTGEVPFFDEVLSTLYARILHEEPVPPSRRNPAVPRDLETICLQAMDKEPERRYEDAGAFADDLRRFLDHRAIAARPPGAALRIRRALKKHRGIVAVGAVAALSVALAGLGAAHFSGSGRLQEAQTDLALKETLEPFRKTIEETQYLFYAANIDLRPKLEELRRGAAEVERLATRPEFRDKPDAWRLLGVAESILGRLDRAEANLKRAAEQPRGDPAADFYLARLYCYQSLRSRLQELAAGGRLGPSPASKALMEKAGAHLRRASLGWSGATDVDLELTAAYAALAEGRIEELRGLCRRGLEKFDRRPGTEEFLVILAIAAEGEERFQHLSEAVRRCPHWVLARSLRAYAALQAGKPAAAIQDVDAVAALSEPAAGLYVARAAARLAGGDEEGARADLRLAEAKDPNLATVHACKGDLLARRRRWAEAEAAYTRALELQPAPASWHFERGKVRSTLGRQKDALRDFEEAVRLDPDFADAHAWRAKVLEWGRDGDGALQAHGQLVRLRPESPETWEGRSRVLFDQGRYEEALEDAERGLKLDPRRPQGRVARARALFKLGRTREALNDLDGAVAAAPAEPVYRFVRAEVRGRLKDRAGAVEDLEACLKAAPSDWPYRREAERLKAQLLAEKR